MGPAGTAGVGLWAGRSLWAHLHAKGSAARWESQKRKVQIVSYTF